MRALRAVLPAVVIALGVAPPAQAAGGPSVQPVAEQTCTPQLWAGTGFPAAAVALAASRPIP